MKAKSGDGQQQPMPLGKPPAHGRGVQRQMPVQAQRPAGPSQRPEQPPGPQQKRTTLGDLRAAARKFAAEAEQAFQSQTTKLTPKPTMPAPEPKAQPDMAPIIEPTAAPFKGRAYKQAATAEMPPTQQLSDLLADYSDPEKLRKAILHYEILGPPVSLRD